MNGCKIFNSAMLRVNCLVPKNTYPFYLEILSSQQTPSATQPLQQGIYWTCMSQLEKIRVTRFNCFADLVVLSNPSSIFIGVSICPIDEVRVKLAWRFKRSIFILVTEPISSSKGEFVFRNLSSSVSHSRTSSISGFAETLRFLPVLGRKVG